jgi:hypothetical protein
MPKMRLLMPTNLAEDEEEGITSEEDREPITQA